jgi:radical SAM protein with 4Fe4S-binding SPASM domain
MSTCRVLATVPPAVEVIHSVRASVGDTACRVVVVDAPEALTSTDGLDDLDVDLLYSPPGQELDAELGAQFASCARAPRMGILSPKLGTVLTSASHAALRQYFLARGPQDDESVYQAGAQFRAKRDEEHEAVPLPRQVYLGLTQRCNRSCSFCVSRTFAFDMLSLEEIERIAHGLKGSVEVIALTGAGEAMVHPEFWEAIDLLSEMLPGVRFKMNTSGVALVKNARRLVQYPVKNVTVSLNATNEETYARFVGRGFHAVLRGIEALVDARAEAARSDLRICLSMVLMNSTVGESSDLVRLGFELGVEEIQGIYLMVNDAELADESPYHQPVQSNAALDEARDWAKALGVKASLPPKFRIGGSAAGAAQAASLPTRQGQACVEPWSTVYIRPDGEVLPCPYFERSLGSIRRADLATIWSREPYQDLRRQLVSGDYCDECRHCCGFNESGSVDDYRSHWIGTREPVVPVPMAR